MDLLDWFFSFSTAHNFNFSFSNEVTLTSAFDTKETPGLELSSLHSTMIAELPPLPLLTDRVTHVVCSPHVYGLNGNSRSSIKLHTDRMIDGGSNICVTGDLGSLLDVVDIKPITISVALEGSSTSYDDCIIKQGLLPMSLSDGTTYY
jgi:hypothetical protein